jgi:hypothetical protein
MLRSRSDQRANGERNVVAAFEMRSLDMSQTSLADYVEISDRAGPLTRYTDEKRVDQIPMLMEKNLDTAIFVEHVNDCTFPFLANAFGARSMHAVALDGSAWQRA